MVEEIEEFFIDYNRMRERDFKPLEICGPKKSTQAD